MKRWQDRSCLEHLLLELQMSRAGLDKALQDLVDIVSCGTDGA